MPGLGGGRGGLGFSPVLPHLDPGISSSRCPPIALAPLPADPPGAALATWSSPDRDRLRVPLQGARVTSLPTAGIDCTATVPPMPMQPPTSTSPSAQTSQALPPSLHRAGSDVHAGSSFAQVVMKYFQPPSLPLKVHVPACTDSGEPAVFFSMDEINGFFKSSRGFHQGDPIAPTLFILSEEALSRGLSTLFYRNIGGAYFTLRRCPLISHLLFADDTLIFSNGLARHIRSLMMFLKKYEASSGQLINVSKSAFIISDRAPLSLGHSIADLTGFVKARSPFWYLGVTLFCGRDKLVHFSHIISKTAAKLQSWKSGFLSSGGRLVLVRHVLSALPIYTMSSQAIPGLHAFSDSTCEHLAIARVHCPSAVLDGALANAIGMDRWIWCPTPNGIFTSKSVRSILQGDSTPSC
ncbi:hypothetical protein Taro_047941 [Colocasia esculenta]|uniref:Reverse transcriptase domain-containing protein n=1 Tax=Colocasia esculenta TaxID=4460 RepID=A0A843X730_COLES|nr:hypothetical protein [Colocasia esculenta]